MFDWLDIIANFITLSVLGLEANSNVASAVSFFVADTIKIFILIIIIIFVITFIRSYFPPERTRRMLSEKKGNKYIAHLLAGLLGIVTPFCSCSAVPLFIGFVEAGIPLGVTFTYLIAAPMVNEVALGLLYSLFGIKIALTYIISGEVIAIVSGIIIGRLKLDKYVEEYVRNIKVANNIIEDTKISLQKRLSDSLAFTFGLIKSIWIYIIIGIGIGSIMHGWVPTGALSGYLGADNPFAVLIAVLIGIPLYSNAAGVIPLVSELTRAGVSMGTALAFMMAITALSIPEMILLRKVLKPRLLIIFISIVGLGIILVGYMFNYIFSMNYL